MGAVDLEEERVLAPEGERVASIVPIARLMPMPIVGRGGRSVPLRAVATPDSGMATARGDLVEDHRRGREIVLSDEPGGIGGAPLAVHAGPGLRREIRDWQIRPLTRERRDRSTHVPPK